MAIYSRRSKAAALCLLALGFCVLGFIEWFRRPSTEVTSRVSICPPCRDLGRLAIHDATDVQVTFHNGNETTAQVVGMAEL
jgi:hypothetical protein